MGIGRKRDGTFYIRCDWDVCSNQVDLKATDFYAASAEAKKLGWVLGKSPSGGWVNFCTEFCKTCYNAPQIRVKRKKKAP